MAINLGCNGPSNCTGECKDCIHEELGDWEFPCDSCCHCPTGSSEQSCYWQKKKEEILKK